MTIPTTMASTPASRNVSHGERFNRRPLYITVVIVALFAFGLYYAAQSRVKPKESFASTSQNLEVLNNGQDYQAIDFIQGQSDGLVNAIAPKEVNVSDDDSKNSRESDIADRLAKMIEEQQLSELDRNYKFQKKLLARQFELAQLALEGDIDIQGFGDDNRSSSLRGVTPEAIISASGQVGRTGRGNAETYNPNSQANVSSGTSNNAAMLSGALASSTDASGVIENRDFVSGEYRNDFTLFEPVNKPDNKYQVMTGTLIPGVMVSAANSELPGDLIAQVTQNVYDSVTGRHVLIPQGTKIFGRYDSYAALGTERLLMVWDRLILPDGETITIGSIQGYDERGLSGAKDIVRTQFWKTLANAFLLSVATGAADALVDESANSENILADITANFGSTTTTAFDEYLRSRLKIKPTFEIRSGYRFNIIVNRDINFPEPYEFGYTRLELQQ